MTQEQEQNQEPQGPQRTQFEVLMEDTLAHLTMLYDTVRDHDEEQPIELMEKLTVYGQIFQVIGDLQAFAIGQAELNYAYRKEVNASAYMSKKKPKEETAKAYTSKEREMVAEYSTLKFRRLEAQYRGEAKKWENRREAVLEQINIMKRKQDGNQILWDRANSTNGYA
jgi:hypothetical protein